MEEALRAWDELRKVKAPDTAARGREVIDAYPEAFASFANLPLSTCVQLVSDHRQAGNDLERIKADIWCQAEHGPQNVTGVAHVGGH